MIKRFTNFLLVLFLSASTTLVMAQNKKTYDHDHFQLIKSSNNLIYTFDKYEGFDHYELILYSPTGDLLNRIEYVSKSPLEIKKVVNLGENTVFHMDGADGDRILVLGIDGKEKSSKPIEFTDKVRDIDMIANANGITLVVEVKRKKVGVGILVQHYAEDVSLTWTYEKFPEKGKYFIYDATINDMGSIALTYKNGNSDNYGLIVLRANGDEAVFADIDEQELPKFTPYKFTFTTKDELLMISDFGSTSSETFKGIPLGMNVMKINATDGTMISSNSITYIEVQEAVGDKRADGSILYKEGPALRVLDIKTINGAETMVCESYIFKERSYTKPSTSSSSVASTTYFKQLLLMDFYLLKVDNPKVGIHRIWKPSRAVEVEASSFTSAEGLCNIFDYNRFFSYQGMVNNSLLIRGFGQMHNYLNTIKADEPYESLVTRRYWGIPLSCKPSSRPLYQSYVKGLSSFLAKDLARTGILETNSGFVLYRYDSVTNKISFENLTF